MQRILWEKKISAIDVQKTLKSLEKESDNVKFERIRVMPDGNCLFRALSRALYGDENDHAIIRQTIVDYTVENFDDIVSILLASNVEIQYQDAAHYRSTMEQDAAWGTDFELGMFARLYKKRVTLWKLVAGQYSFPVSITPDEVDEEKAINILFTGNRRSGHFDLLEDKCPGDCNKNEQDKKVEYSPAHSSRLNRTVTFHQSMECLLYKFRSNMSRIRRSLRK